MPRQVFVRGYDPLGDHVTADAELHIKGAPPPEVDGQWYDLQAEMIARVLFTNLPQATVERVLIVMLEHYTGCYRGRSLL